MGCINKATGQSGKFAEMQRNNGNSGNSGNAGNETDLDLSSTMASAGYP